MATKLEDLVIRLKADSSDLERELRKSGVAVSGFAKKAEGGFASLETAAKRLGATIAVAFVANKIREFASAALELGSSLNDTARRLGTTAEALQVYRLQAKEAGVDSGAVDSSLQSFEKTLGLLQRGLGRATKQLQLLDPELLAALKTAKGTDEAYRLVADSLKRMADAHQDARAASVAAATGMSPLLGVLKEGAAAFDTMGERARASGLVLSNEAAAGLDAFGEALDRVKQTIIVGFAEGLASVDAGSQSFTETLTDPEMLQGLHDLAAILGTIALGATKVAEGFEWAVRATREMLGILPHVQGAIPPGGLSVWQRNLGTMPGVLPPDSGMVSRGEPFRFGDSAPGSLGGSGSPPPYGVAAPKGGKGKGNAAPQLDYAITHFDYFAAEKLAMKNMVDDYDKGMKEMTKSSAAFVEEGTAHFRDMEQAAEAFGSFAGNIFNNLVRDGKIDFKSLAMSFAEMMVEMEARALASKILGVGSQGGGKDTTGFLIGLIGSILSLGGGLLGGGGGGGGGGGEPVAVADGGYFTKPTLAMIGEGKESEWALPNSKLKALLAASGGKTVVNVNNYTSDDVKTTTRRRGDTDIIDIMVRQSISRQLSAGAMKDEFRRRHAPGVS